MSRVELKAMGAIKNITRDGDQMTAAVISARRKLNGPWDHVYTIVLPLQSKVDSENQHSQWTRPFHAHSMKYQHSHLDCCTSALQPPSCPIWHPGLEDNTAYHTPLLTVASRFLPVYLLKLPAVIRYQACFLMVTSEVYMFLHLLPIKCAVSSSMCHCPILRISISSSREV